MKKLKPILFGLAVFILGYFICGILASIFSGGNAENSAISAVFFALLFLSGVISVFAYMLLKEVKKD